MHEAADSLEIGHERFHTRRIVQRSRRMVYRRNQKAACLAHRTAQVTYARIRFQDELRGELAERHDEVGHDGSRLFTQERRAQLDFLGPGVTISGRAAFQHVRDVDVVAGKPRDRKQVVEHVPGGAHEWLAL